MNKIDKKSIKFCRQINKEQIECFCYRCGAPTVAIFNPECFYWGVNYTVSCQACLQLEHTCTNESILTSAACMVANSLLNEEMA